MIIKIDYKTFRHITKQSMEPAMSKEDALTRHEYYIMRQTLLALAGKDCSPKVRKQLAP